MNKKKITTIHMANVRSKSALHQLRTGNEHAQGNRTTLSEIISNTEAYGIQHRILESLYSDLRSKLQGLHNPIENLEERLTRREHGYQNTKSRPSCEAIGQQY